MSDGKLHFPEAGPSALTERQESGFSADSFEVLQKISSLTDKLEWKFADSDAAGLTSSLLSVCLLII